MPLVSVVMPVFNEEKYLRECLDGLINQTLEDIEIICVDDGSTDSSFSILQEYAVKDTRIRVFRQSNSGAGIARNYGRTFTSGEYIIFLDSDDIYEPEMLEKLYNASVKDNLQIAVCRSDRLNTNTGEHIACNWTIKEKLLPGYKPFSSRDIKQDFFMAFVWWPWDKLYKKSFIDSLDLEFQDLRTTNDLYFVAGTVLKAERISYVNDILVHHRFGIGESLSVTREKSWDCFYRALLQLRSFLKKESLYQRLEKDFVNYCLHFSLWHLESLHGYSYCLLYKALHDDWFDILNVKNHAEEYFYDKKLFEKMKKVATTDLEHHLMERIWELEKQIDPLKQLATKSDTLTRELEVSRQKITKLHREVMQAEQLEAEVLKRLNDTEDVLAKEREDRKKLVTELQGRTAVLEKEKTEMAGKAAETIRMLAKEREDNKKLVVELQDKTAVLEKEKAKTAKKAAEAVKALEEERGTNLQKEIELRKLKQMKAETDKCLGKTEEALKEERKEKVKLIKDIRRKEKELSGLSRHLQDVKTGWSFRTGRVITFIPRKIRDLFKK